jgi:hypothetical protein
MTLFQNLDGVLWLLLLLGPLFFVVRIVHREIQVNLLLLVRQTELVKVLFSLLFVPGVLLHEFSHFLMAKILGVRTGRFSLIPQSMPDGRLQLGYVETARTDMLRDALIGAAPLIVGGVFVGYAGTARLGLDQLWLAANSGAFGTFLAAFQQVYGLPDFWLWFYLTFTVSSTMLPSTSDRRAWLPLSFVAIGLLVLALFVGLGDWLAQNAAPMFNQVLRAQAMVFAISILLHAGLLPPLLGFRYLLQRLTGLRVNSQ